MPLVVNRAQQPADAVLLLVDRDVVSGAGELLGAGEPGGAGADDGDALAGAAFGHLGLDPALFPGLVDDGAFDGLDGHRGVVDVEGAGGLAGRGADAAGELGEVVGGVQDLDGGLPVTFVDQVVPVRDDVVDRAALVAEGDAAVHAARTLDGEFAVA